MRLILSIGLVVISLVLASCGGASSPTTEIDVTMTDFQFNPTSFTVPLGEEITFHSTNNGAVVHSFVIMNLGQSAGTEYNEEDQPNVYWEVELQPGGSSDTTFTAPSEAGEYEVICHIPGHVQAGMVGKLTVVAGE
ncbi:MAG TPA: plastocyanin/azurin family copper-binding protein [Anaerolineales bacterium]|nr:plastocyanin/azurin family copper-binding protein [Anaerolineales bacterium]